MLKKTLINLINIKFIMNKAELITAMSEKSGLNKTDARKALEAFTECVEDALLNGDKVSLVGFGTFQTIDKAERDGINPATKTKIRIAAKKVVKFKPGAELSDKIQIKGF